MAGTGTRTGVAALEAIVAALGGAALGLLAGWWLHPVLGVAMASVAGCNGVLSGWRGVYGWRRASGWLAFALDSTWATLPVAAGLLTHALAFISRPAGYEPSLSHRRQCHVYRRGAHLKPGFALTVGNVISSAGNVDGPRRRKLITDHEAVHVWQARWFGPCYLPLYGAWAGGAALIGTVLWLVPLRRRQPLAKVLESCAYYLNPFEWWAYSRDGLWPPPGLLHGFGWRAPAARPLAEVRRPRVR